MEDSGDRAAPVSDHRAILPLRAHMLPIASTNCWFGRRGYHQRSVSIHLLLSQQYLLLKILEGGTLPNT